MDFDVLIVGGGLVGATLAHALRDVPLSVGVVEAVLPDDADPPSFDARAIALAHGSVRILDTLGVWELIETLGATPIRRIHVSDRGHFGATRLSAAEEGVEALGYVAGAAVIGRALSEGFARLPRAELICPARVREVTIESEAAEVELDCADGARRLRCRLLVAADGGRSRVRELLGAGTLQVGYGQTAVTANVITERPHGNIAYERFTDSGPLALLPDTAPAGWPGSEYGDRRWSLVWSARDVEAEEMLALDADAFLARLQARFGNRAGRFEQVGHRHSYPLGLQCIRQPVQTRLAFIGNAAHVVHPVAGQGFNLGLRDVAVLAEMLAAAADRNGDPGSLHLLREYARERRADSLRTGILTDSLVRVFSSRRLPAVLARNLGLVGMELFAPARHHIARQAMGLAGRLPKLARGLALTEP